MKLRVYVSDHDLLFDDFVDYLKEKIEIHHNSSSAVEQFMIDKTM